MLDCLNLFDKQILDNFVPDTLYHYLGEWCNVVFGHFLKYLEVLFGFFFVLFFLFNHIKKVLKHKKQKASKYNRGLKHNKVQNLFLLWSSYLLLW